MSEEIEKIIFNLEGCCGMFDYMLTPIENNLLVSYIKQLQQENQQLKVDLQEANDNTTWWNNRFNAVSKENQQLKERIEYLERSNNRREDTIIEDREEITTLYSVLDEIREYIEHEWFKRGQLGIIDKSFQEWQLKDILQILDKVKE